MSGHIVAYDVLTKYTSSIHKSMHISAHGRWLVSSEMFHYDQ